MEQKDYFSQLVMLYYNPSLWNRVMKCGQKRPRGLDVLSFYDLHTFLKEHMAQDVKFTQALLGALPKDNM